MCKCECCRVCRVCRVCRPISALEESNVARFFSSTLSNSRQPWVSCFSAVTGTKKTSLVGFGDDTRPFKMQHRANDDSDTLIIALRAVSMQSNLERVLSTQIVRKRKRQRVRNGERSESAARPFLHVRSCAFPLVLFLYFKFILTASVLLLRVQSDVGSRRFFE